MTAPANTGKKAPADSAVKIAAGGVKKARNEGLKVITANDLSSGGVVYRRRDGSWSDDLRAAALLEGQEALDALAAATADEGSVVGPYLMDVSDTLNPSGRAVLRETIRFEGPTIHPEFARHPRAEVA